MDNKSTDKIAAFDTLFSNNQTQILKIILPYMDAGLQKYLVFYIKLLELQYAMTFFQRHPSAACPQATPEEKKDTSRFFDEILPFCDLSQREKILQLKNMLQNIQNLQEMMETFEMMKEFFPEGMGSQTTTGTSGGGPDLTQILSLLGGFGASDGSSDLANMAEMFQAFSSMNDKNNEK